MGRQCAVGSTFVYHVSVFIALVLRFSRSFALTGIGLKHAHSKTPLSLLTCAHCSARQQSHEYNPPLLDDKKRQERQAEYDFWDNQSFGCVESILKGILQPGTTDRSRLLELPGTTTRDEALDEADNKKYSHLFSALFDMPASIDQTDDDSSRLAVSPSRKRFRLDVGYRGKSFCGWQTQPNNKELPSVQKTLEDWLQPLAGNISKRVDLRVTGRTDAGVSAIGQVCRFRTGRQDISVQDVKDHLNQCPLVTEGSLRCLSVQSVPDRFHPTFAATCRAYVYMLDASGSITKDEVHRLDSMLRCLEGRQLDYVGMSYGRVKTSTTLCTIHFARVSLVRVVSDDSLAYCVQLVGDRFLRRMVRILVATALREAMREDSTDHALLDLVEKRDRTATAGTAPPDGLIFVGASFG